MWLEWTGMGHILIGIEKKSAQKGGIMDLGVFIREMRLSRRPKLILEEF